MAPSVTSRSQRYVGWLRRRSAWVLIAGFLVVQAALYLTVFHLPLRADFANLLPQDAPSVRDLRRLEARVPSQDTLLVVIEAPTPEVRREVAEELTAALRALPPELVTRVDDDDAETRAFLRAHRHLFVPLDDLKAAREALSDQIRRAKLAANPAYVEFDEEASAAEDAAARKRLDELRARRREAEARLDHSGHITADGLTQQLVVLTGFAKTDADGGQRLMAAVESARAQALARPGRDGVRIGFAGGVTGMVAEHNALIRGVLRSSLVTAVLVAVVLALYFRSIRLLALLTVALVVGTLAAFGVAAFTVGHLNAATAFLGAIIAGNGVNYGILLVARFLEERRLGLAPEPAMAEAIRGTLRPTLVASLGASIAYGALAATSFRGFADFAVIGAIGMLLCWIASYTLLPAMMMRWVPRLEVSTSDPVLGGWLARLLGFKKPRTVVAVAAGVAVLGGVIAWRFVATDPYEYDIKQLRSRGPDAQAFHRWAARSDEAFGRGISGHTFIAADRPDQVPQIVDALRAIDAGVPADQRTIGTIRSILDVMPADQSAKIAVLHDIRDMIDQADLEQLEPQDRADIAALRPPDRIEQITPERLPEAVRHRLREANGQLGLIVAVRPDLRLDEWDARELARFATAVRALRLPDGQTVTTSGPPIIYSDIIATIQDDAPLVVSIAVVLLVVMVLLVVGRNLRAFAVLFATALGSILLVAVCAMLDLEVTFLDFIALPITLGLGIDYAINIANRHHDGDSIDPADTLRTSGAAVFVCSLTTIIGYGSLLASDNLGIRGFGMASLIGEVCCMLTALAVVPALVGLSRERRPAPATSAAIARQEE